jgi:hypothetical protein
MGVKEEEIQTEGIENLFNRIILENFPNLRKSHPGIGNLHNTKPSGPKEKHHQILSTHNKEGILKAAKEKRQVACKGKPIRITTCFSN